MFLVENISLGRQPYVNMAAVYMIEATDKNVDSIGRDFTPPTKKLVSGRTGPMYASAHIFFTTPLPQALLNKLAQTPAAPYVKTLQEVNLNFIPVEARAFHLGRASPHFAEIFAPMIPDGPETVSLSAEMERMAAQIVSACTVLGDMPRVRFRKSASDHRSGRLALRVQKKLEEMATSLTESRAVGRSSTLLIVDRTVDLVAPLLHEFSVQAMATDLLDLGPDGSRYEYSYSTATGSQKKSVSLDERDQLWTILRHAHIADCSQLIIERFNKFLMENKAAVKSRTTSAGNDVTSLAELKDTMAALSEFHEMKAEFSLHLSIAQDCLSQSERKKLIEVAGLEQDMATGADASGEPVRDLWNALVEVMSRPALTSADRARLVGIYLLTNPKPLSEADCRTLFDAARLDPIHVAALRRLSSLAAGANYRQRRSARPRGSKRYTCLDESASYDVSRFHPALKLIMEDVAFDQIDVNEFPLVKPDAPGSHSTASSARPTATSLRSKSTVPSATSGSAAVTSEASAAVFVYVLGGCTYSEVRAAYELSHVLKRDFFVGGDALLTPSSFLDRLQ